MPATPSLVVDDSTGTEKFRIDAIEAQRTDSLIEMWTATATVDRSTWLNERSNLDEVNDRVRIERSDGSTLREGRFANDERDGNTVVVTVNSYEQDALDAEPTDARVIYNNVSDDTVATDAINAVPTLSLGTIDSVASNVSFTFAHAAQSKVLRDAAEPGGLDVRYNPDRTVDFLDRLGTDKPNTAISSTDQNIVDSLSVEENSRDPVTHIRGLGAQSGGEQVQAEAVISSYSSGDRKVWREYTNKDVVNNDRMQTIVDRLATEYDSERRRIIVEAGLVGVDVSLGDRITVDLPQHNIDRLLRVTRLQELISNATKKIVTLTNRKPERGGDRKRRDDLSRFNSGDQGFVDRDTFRAVERQPVDSGLNATGEYPYPDDVVREDKAEIVVRSIPYRAYSSGGAAGGDHTHTVEVTHPEHGHDVTIGATTDANTEYGVVDERDSGVGNVTLDDSSWTTMDSWSPFGATSELQLMTLISYGDLDGDLISVKQRIYDATEGEYIPDSSGHQSTLQNDIANSSFSLTPTFGVPGDRSGNDLRWQGKIAGDKASDSFTYRAQWYSYDTHQHVFGTTTTSDNELGTTQSETSDASGDHTHPPQPGLVEFPTEEASGVDVVVNGSTVATDIGSGTFTETVDLSGVLTPGDNDIEITSDSLGLVTAYVETQLFRSGGPSP